LDVRKQLDQILIEAEISQTPGDLPIFNQKCTVARHARHDFLIRIDLPDIPKTRHQNAPIRGGNHLLDRRIAARDHDIHRRLAKLGGHGKSVPGRLYTLAGGGLAAISHVLDDAMFYQSHQLARHPFTIEWHTRLQRVTDIVIHADVVAEQLVPDAVREKAAL